MRWKTLEHNGILFPPPFETKGITVRIRGKETRLGTLAEEMAYQWAKKKDTPYVQDAVFQKNFTADFARELGPEYRGLKYGEIDFTAAYRLVDGEKEARERMTKEERKELARRRKAVREELKAKYGKAVLDGKDVDVGNYMAEPPGIFIGRGAHPFRGKWKAAISHRDVTLNMGKKAARPPGDWKKIVCKPDSIWLACWTDGLTKKAKYIWFADTVSLKQDRDRAKYDKAVTLSGKIDAVRKSMIKDMASRNERVRNVATVCYLIYRTAMRVGDEKDSDEADTVGATTLRKEHVKVGKDTIEFDFLGKDSVRWTETLKVGDDTQFRDNLKSLMEGKGAGEEIFAGITSRNVNVYLSGIVKGVSAKVFRTYLGSNIVNSYLAAHANITSKSANTKVYHAKLANLEAAKMLNHKRTIPKTFAKSLEKKRETLKNARAKATKTPKQAEKKAERIERLKMQLDLAERTSDYNLGTSLRNYVDPRVFKAWIDEVGANWEKVYTGALQRKFLWVQDEKTPWKKVKRMY